MTFKLKINLLALFVLASCVEKQPETTKLEFNNAGGKPASGGGGNTGGGGSSGGGGGVVVGEAELDKNIALKTFNQYNMSLSKVTGIDPTTPAISTEYGLIKNSLPGEHGATNFTPFNQIAMVRLSAVYCDVFINSDAAFSGQAVNYATITAQAMATKLLERFVGARSDANSVLYDKYNADLVKIMNNDAGKDENGADIGMLVPVATGVALKQNLSKLACTAVLSSAEFTTL